MSHALSSDHERTAAWASLVLRLAIASLFIATSVAKLGSGWGSLEALVDMLGKPFAETWLPVQGVVAYLYLAPFIEAVLPLWLLTGVRLRLAWVVTCVFLITLAFGKTVVQDYATSAQNYNYVLIAVLGLYLSPYDRFSLRPRRRPAPAVACGEGGRD